MKTPRLINGSPWQRLRRLRLRIALYAVLIALSVSVFSSSLLTLRSSAAADSSLILHPSSLAWVGDRAWLHAKTNSNDVFAEAFGSNAGMFSPASPMFFSALTPGNLLVAQVGDGVAVPTGSSAQVALVEYTTAGGASVQTIAVNSSGASPRLTVTGSATSEGFLVRSSDGKFLTLTGYDVIAGTATGFAAAGTPRVIGRIDSAGTVDLTTALTDGSTGAVRSAGSTNGTDLWQTNSVVGLRYKAFGSSGSSIQSTTTPTNTRVVKVVNGQLYMTSGSATFTCVNSVGSGAPTSSGNTTTAFTGMICSARSPYSFSISPSGTTMYVADDGGVAANGGIQKWALSSGTWSNTYTLLNNTVTTTAVRGLTVDWSGANPIIYATTTAATANTLIKVTDTGSGSTATTIATAPTNKVFRGVDFVPEILSVTATSPADAATGVATNSTISVTFNTAVDTSTITRQSASGVCSGSLQVSSDSFSTCIGLGTPAASGGNTIFTATPSAALANSTTYKIRVTTAAKTATGSPLSAAFTQATGFTTVALPSASINNVTKSEGSAGPNSFDFTVTLSAASATSTTINYSTHDGTATAGSDYTTATSSIIIPALSTTGTISITVNGDTTPELDEAFTVTLDGATGATIGSPSTGTGTITNDDVTGGTYTWTGSVLGADWPVATNWSPARVLPQNGDILVFDSASTPSPIVNKVTTQQIATLRLIGGCTPTFNAVSASQVLTIAGGTGTDFSIPSGNSLTVASSNGLTIALLSPSVGTVGGSLVFDGGPHQLTAASGATVSFSGVNAFATSATYSASTHPFGDGNGTNNDAILFQSGSTYNHANGLSPFGTGTNHVVKFMAGSEARFVTTTGFEASGRTYANLTLGQTDPGGVAVAASPVSGSGDFQFDNLILNSPAAGGGSSLSYTGTGASTIKIHGNITSNGGSGSAQDVILAGGSGGIAINKTGGGTLTFGHDTNNTKAIEFESDASVGSGTTLALSRKLLMSISQPSAIVLSIDVDGALTGDANGYVIGKLRKTLAAAGPKTFEVGTVNGYSQVDMTAAAGGTFPTVFTVSASATQEPHIHGVTVNALKRYWTLSEDSGSITADLVFHYLDPTDIPTNINAGFTDANYILFKYDGSFARPAATIDTTANTASITGVSSFSDWTLADPNAVQEGSLQFSSATYTPSEGVGSLLVTVTRTGGVDGAVSVAYGTNSGTAISGSDFTTTGGVLNWADGDATNQTFSIPITDDSLYEGNEDFTVALSSPTGGASLGANNPATITIVENDSAPTISIADASLAEGGGSMSFTVTQSAVSGLTTNFQYSTTDGSATAGSDFTGALNLPGSIIAGNTTTTISIPITNDNVYENTETFTVTLNTPVNATIATGTATGTITDDDSAPTFSINSVAQNEGNGGAGTTSFTFTVTKSGLTGLSSSVRVDTLDGTALAASDYAAIVNQTLTFGPSDVTMPVTVLVNGDTTPESNETFSVKLSNPSNATIPIAGDTGTGTILDDDACAPPNTVYVDDDWAGTTLGTDPDSGGPATNFGCDSFATIQDGINGVAPGGSVIVNAGNYTEQLTISKSLTLTGQNTATTVLHTPATLSPRIGGNLVLVQIDTAANVNLSGITVAGPRVTGGCSSAIFYGIYAVGGSNLNLHDAAVTDIRLSPDSLLGCQDGIAVRAGSVALSQTATLTVNNVAISGYQKSAIIVDNTGTTGTITNNTLTGLGPANLAANAIQIGRGAAATVTGNTITGNECSNAVCGPDPFTQAFSTGVLIFSTSATIHINNNTISNNDAGIYNNGDSTTISGNTMPGNRYDGIFLDQGTASITGNTISGPMNAGVAVVSFTAADGTSGNSVGTMTGNTVTGATSGLQLLDADQSSDSFEPLLTAHFNRIVSTTNAVSRPSLDAPTGQVTVRGSIMQALGVIDGRPLTEAGLSAQRAPAPNTPSTNSLENNWWGCNAGPGNPGCGNVGGTSVVDFNPWIVLAASATPNSISPGGTSNVSADMTHNSDGAVPVGTLPNIPDAWSATNGTMNPTTGTVITGADTSQFTSTNGSSGSGCVTVDNQQTCAPITVNAPAFSIDDVTHFEGNGGTTTYVFTVTKTGATGLSSSVQFQTQDGTATLADNDYQANSGTLNFGPSDTTMPITVLVNGDTTVELDEAFNVHLSSATNATISDADGTGTIKNDDTPCTPPSTVYVDDDWVGTPPGTDPDGIGPATNFGCDSFATIQEGVNGVAIGGNVIVRAGTYPEAILINKSVILRGPGFGQNTETRFAAFTNGPNGPKADPTVEAIITAAATAPTSAANDTVHIMADVVTVVGFVIDGNNPALVQTGATVIGGINTDSRRAIQTEDAAGNPFAANHVAVQDNVIQNFAQRGVELINGTASNTAPATTNSAIATNVIRNFGLDGIVLAFNAHAVINSNTIIVNDYPTEAGIWVQDFLNTGTPYPITISNNNITVGQDNFGGIWVNLAYMPALNINNNTVNAAASVAPVDDFTYGIYLTSLRPGSNASLDGNIVGSSGGTFDRAIALWNLGTGQTTTVTGGTVGHAVKGVSLHDNDPNFGFAGSNSAVDLSGVSIDGTGVGTSTGIFVDATGSTGDTVAMQISGNTSIINTTTAISVAGANASANIHDNVASIHNNTTGISVDGGSATITKNQIYSNATSLLFGTSGSATAHFNRIISTTTAIANPNNLTPNLENNWWGCNAGPGNAGCGAVTGTGADFDPWIVLGVSAVPASVSPGGNSTVTADMTKNSNGLAAGGTLPDIPVAWSATNGTMSPTNGTVTASQAQSTFTSSNSSPGTACAMVDNQQVCTPIAVTLPSFTIDDVTHNEGNGGPGSTSYTFTITKTGAGAASVDYNTADGTATAPSDYTAIPATTVSFLSADTTKQVTVLVNGDTAFEGNETFTVHLSNAVGATISDADGVGTIMNDDACGGPFATVYVDDSWAAVPLGSDPDGPGPATSFGCDSFATIQGGVTAVTAGGTVIVYDGTYTENVTISKPVVLKGNQFGVDARGRVAAESIVSPAVAGTATFLLNTNTTTTVIDGFTFTGGTSLGVIQTQSGSDFSNLQISNNRFSGYSQSAVFMNRGGSNITIDKNVMDGSNIAGSGQAIFSNTGAFNGLFITNNNIVNNAGRYGFFVDGTHNVGESATRAPSISGNLFDKNLQGLNLGSRSFGTNAAPVLPAATYGGFITNNTFSNNTANGIQAGIQHVLVKGNTFANNAIDGLALTSFGNTGADRGAQNSKIVSNTFTGQGRAGIFFSGTQGTGSIETNHANFNRIVGNAVGVQYGSTVAAGNNATIDVENNWWGCNYGPGTGGAGCGATPNGTLVFAGNSGVLDSNPWIVLGTSASPNPIPPDGNSTVTADMTHNSDNVVPSPTDFVPPVGVSFTAANGTMAPPSGTITSGQAQSTFTSTSSSSGSACAVVDNQQVCTPITVMVPSFSIDDVTHNEGNGGPGSTSYTFTITKTGSGAASVDYATVDGTATAPSDYTAIPTTTVSFQSADTTKQVTVLVNGDTAFEGNETFTVHLSNAVGATISDADGLGTIMNDDSCGGPFSTVYVDDSWAAVPLGSDPDGPGPATSFGCDSFATIQEGVNAVTSGGTVIVYDGTYTENATIPKPLTLTGAGAATVFLKPAVSNPNCGGAGGGSLCAGGSNLILVQADNVTISGLTLDGDNPALPGGINVGGANVDARNGIITNHLMGLYNNLEVHHTTVKNIYLRGMYASSGGTFNFHDNTVQNVQGEAASIGMFNFGGAGAYTNNNVSACNDAISSNHSRGTTYTGNIVTTSASGIHTDNAGDGGGTFDTISGNTVTNSQTFGYGIWVFVPYKTVRVQNNTVTNVDVGHAVFGDSGSTTTNRPIISEAQSNIASGRAAPKSANVAEPGSAVQTRIDKGRMAPLAPPVAPFAASFTGNTVDGQNKANSTGVYFSTSQLGFGSGNPKVEFKSNTVINNVDGFYLEAETGFTLETAASFNRIVNNTNSQVTQASGAGFTGMLNGSMENNWWGCNAGPNNAGCGSVVGADVDFNPWLVLGVSALPNPIGPGGTSTVTADMTHNSNNAVPSLTDFVPPVLVSFTAANGTMAPPSGTITSGQAQSTFTSTSPSAGSACAMVDNQQVCTPITIALPSFSIDDVQHSEGDVGTTIYTFTVTKTGATTFGSSVDFTTQDNTAKISDNDYQTNSGNLSFAPNETTKPVTVLVNGDTKLEPDETFIVHLSNANNATISDADGVGTITNDDGGPNFTISDVTMVEGDAGQTNFVFTVTKNGTTGERARVSFATADGMTNPATGGGACGGSVDYLSQSGTLSFPVTGPGSTSQTITVPVCGDTTFEPDETFFVNLSNPVNATISDNQGLGTILNDECTLAPVNMVSWWRAENNANDIAGPNSGTFVGTPAYAPGKVGQAFSFDGSGASYVEVPDNNSLDLSSKLTIDAWISPVSAAANSRIVDKITPSTVDGYLLDLENGHLRFIGVNIAVETTETVPANTFTHVAVTYDGAQVVLYLNGVAVKTTPLTGAVSTNAVPLRIGLAQNGAVAFAGLIDEVEIFNRALTATEVANLSTASGAGKCRTSTIQFAQANTNDAETNAGSHTVNVVVTRNGDHTGAVDVTYTVTDGTATTADGDYSITPATGTLHWNDGDSTPQNIVVTVFGDNKYELNETVNLTLSNVVGVGASLGTPNPATLTITNDDPAPTLSINDVSATEGTSPPAPKQFVFTVTRSGSTGVSSTVDFATADDTLGANPATSGAGCGPGVDYIATTGALTFPASGLGSASQTISIPVCRESVPEPNETFLVNLSNPGDATINDGQGLGTIVNDDFPPGGFVVNTTADGNDGACTALGTGNGCTLREAILAANSSPSSIGINFGIPGTDSRHFYYKDDGVPNQVTNDPSHVLVTTAANDAGLPADKDPDWPHGWWSILPTSPLPNDTQSVIIDGYTQTEATVNSLTASDNAVLRIELDGISAGAGVTGLTLSGGASIVRGLAVNRFTSNGLQGGGSGNSITGNFIGTDVSGTLDLGNAGSGVSCTGSMTVGGSSADLINLISGNDGDGILFTNSNSNLVQGNFIGTKANGISALGNSGSGINLTGPSTVFNTVGDVTPGTGNTIAFNTLDGVRAADAGIANTIRGNSIFSNGSTANDLGIDLGVDGVTANDNKDPDSGPNTLQNFPVITSARVTGSTRTITGTLNSTPGGSFTIDFYQNLSCDTSGNGEGKTYIGSTSVTTDGTTGDVSFLFHPSVLTIGQSVTATATSDSGVNTSEFSACAAVIDGAPGAGDIQFTSATYSVAENVVGGMAPITLIRVGGTNGSISATFTTSDGTANQPGDYTAVNQVVTFGEGVSSMTVNVPIIDDTRPEANETVNLSLGATSINAAQGDGPSLINPHAAVLTINDNDPCPTTFTVNSNLDTSDADAGDGLCATSGGVCTLRAAIEEANALTACGTIDINFSIGPATISLTVGQLTVDHNVNINGPALSSVVISGNNTSRVFRINSGKTVGISNLTISGGNAVGSDGGGISNGGGALTLTNSTVSGNVAQVWGGGIYNDAGTLTLTNSTISGNSATTGGGITHVFGGGINLTNSTVTGNSAGGGGYGGITNTGGTINVRNTIIAANFPVGQPDISGSFTTQGNNLIGKNDSGTGFANGVNGDQVGTVATPIDPLLGALMNNGGPTFTHGLLYNSPAVDAGNDCVNTVAHCSDASIPQLTLDQRGLPRQADGDLIVGAHVDIGAYERQATETRPVGTGSNIHVDLNDVRLAFPTVSGTRRDDGAADGLQPAFVNRSVSITVIPVPVDAPPASGPAFDVTPSSAFYTPPVDVCFYLPSITNPATFSTLKVLHRESGVLTDHGEVINFASKTVCTEVTSFSDFVITHGAFPSVTNGTIDGTITDSNGAPLAGTTISLSGTQTREAITDAAGKYSFDDVATNGFYTVTPSRANYSFNPANRSFSALGAHTESSFTAAPNGEHANAIDTTEFFVRQQYLDFLGREPDPPGFNGWVNTLRSCAPGDASCDRIHVSEMFFRSAEFQERGYFVYRFYSAGFGRKPDYAEFTPDLGRVSGFLTNDQLEAAKTGFANDFMTRPAFAAQYGSLSNGAYVDALINTAGVHLSNRQALVDSLNNGTATRAQVLRQVAESVEVYQQYYNQAFVVMEYFGYLRRDPDALYLNWISVLDANPADSRHMVGGFVNSLEYRNRFAQ